MHLIAALAAGVRGAENGSASILKRGLTSRATYYTSFEGGAVTPAGDVTLDSNGGGTFYVNELCTVVCKDSNGTPVRTFTAGESSPAVEVISPSFTGVNYETGQSGASNPTTLQAALDKLKTSFGTTDFNVLVNGVSTALSTAVANSITSLFFNVKASAYGAVGDGSTDDTTAVNAAITAASAAGGGTVFFPKGTYKMANGILTVPAGVSLLGAGAGASSVTFGNSGTFLVSKTGAVGRWDFIRDLDFSAVTVSVIVGVHAGWVRIDGCRLNGDAGSVPVYTDDVDGNVLVVGCTLIGASGAGRFFANCSSGRMQFLGCTFVYPSGVYDATSSITGQGVSVIGCTFKLGTVTSGTSTIYNASSSTPNLIVGNNFETVGGSGTPVVTLHFAALQIGFVEMGNFVGSGYTLPTATFAYSLSVGPTLGTRAARFGVQNVDSTPVAIPTSSYGAYEIGRSTNGAQTLTFSDPPGAGHYFTLIFNNNQAGASGTITMGGTNIRGLSSFTAVTANRVSIYTFKSISINAPTPKYVWTLTSSDINENP